MSNETNAIKGSIRYIPAEKRSQPQTQSDAIFGVDRWFGYLLAKVES
jgi:hypothetical protein